MMVRTRHFQELEHRMGPDAPEEHQRSMLGVLGIAELIRSVWGPLRVTSGYRPADTRSQHARGEALDLVPVMHGRLAVAAWLWAVRRSGLVLYDQLIAYTDTQHVHLSYSSTGEQRGEFLIGTPSRQAGKRWDYTAVPDSGYSGPLALELRRLGVSL